jgi:guanylate kinase
MINKEFKGKAIIFSAPSGAGKTTIVKSLLKTSIPLSFSISACSRLKRSNEQDGIDYHFLSVSKFKNKIQENAFIEWEEVYENNFYGTLKSEVNNIWERGKHVIFDVDVMGGISLKNYFKENSLSIFIEPPSLNVLFERLKKRATDDEKSLEKRMNKAESEISHKDKFDTIITNDQLEIAVSEAIQTIEKFIYKS